MEEHEKQGKFFVKHFETIAVLFIIFGVIIFCIIYQPKKVQPILDLVGLRKIDANTPIDIDRAIALFSKEANKKIPKGSSIIIRKLDLKIPDNATKEIIHWKIKQNFIERGDIDVYGNDSIVIQDIKDKGEVFTIRARLEKYEGVSSRRVIDELFDEDNDYYNYVFFISIDKNGRKAATDVSILMRNYAILNELSESSNEEIQTNTFSKSIEKPIEKSNGDSLIEQECITELEESLLSFLDYKGEHSKQIKILYDDKNCKSEIENDKCKYKSKCFSYDHHNSDACGSTDMKNNFSIKGCPVGSTWKYNFCEPDVEEPYYSVPENIDCKNITPKRVRDNTTFKSRF